MAVNGEKAVFLPADDEEAIRERVAEAKAAQERAAHEQAIKREQSSLRWALVIFAIGAGLLLLSFADWLPQGLNNILAGPPGENRAGPREGLLGVAGFVLVLATLSYLDLRALRLGTERARKQANAAKAVTKWLLIAGSVLAIGVLLLVLGIVISDWLASDRDRFPFFIVSFVAHWPVLIATLFALPWISERTKTAGLIFAVIVLSALLATDVAVGLFSMWDWAQVAPERELPLWLAFVQPLPNVVVAPFLLWGIVIAVRRLRALTAEPLATDFEGANQ